MLTENAWCEGMLSEDIGTVWNMLCDLDLYEGLQFKFVFFQDCDGEDVYLRAADIELLEAPHVIFIDPDEKDDGDELDNDEASVGLEADADFT